MRQAATDCGVFARSRFAPTGLPREGADATRVPLSNVGARGDPDRRSYPAGAPTCRIYRPSQSVMQAGGRTKGGWVLAFEPRSPEWIEPLMGWTASADPWAQIQLKFPDLASAVDYAERQGLDYRVVDPPARRSSRRQHPDLNREFGRSGSHDLSGCDRLELMMTQ